MFVVFSTCLARITTGNRCDTRSKKTWTNSAPTWCTSWRIAAKQLGPWSSRFSEEPSPIRSYAGIFGLFQVRRRFSSTLFCIVCCQRVHIQCTRIGPWRNHQKPTLNSLVTSYARPDTLAEEAVRAERCDHAQTEYRSVRTLKLWSIFSVL